MTDLECDGDVGHIPGVCPDPLLPETPQRIFGPAEKDDPLLPSLKDYADFSKSEAWLNAAWNIS